MPPSEPINVVEGLLGEAAHAPSPVHLLTLRDAAGLCLCPFKRKRKTQMLKAIVLTLLLCHSGRSDIEDPYDITVDRIELNHVYSLEVDNGWPYRQRWEHHLSQFIIWRRHASNGEYHVRDFLLVKDASFRLVRHNHQAILYVDGFTIRGRAFIETNTDFDRELEDRKVFHQNERETIFRRH